MKAINQTIKAVALYKCENPASTLKEIAQIFNLKPHQVRYAIDKYAGQAKFLKGNKAGKSEAAKVIAKNVQDITLFNKQLGYIIAKLDGDDSIPLKTRIDYLYRITKMKTFIQEVELERHLKRTDATIISALIKRFVPEATNEDVINIYNEEYQKWLNSKRQ